MTSAAAHFSAALSGRGLRCAPTVLCRAKVSGVLCADDNHHRRVRGHAPVHHLRPNDRHRCRVCWRGSRCATDWCAVLPAYPPAVGDHGSDLATSLQLLTVACVLGEQASLGRRWSKSSTMPRLRRPLPPRSAFCTASAPLAAHQHRTAKQSDCPDCST